MYLFATAEIKCHGLGGLDNRNVFSHNSGGQDQGCLQSYFFGGPFPWLVGCDLFPVYIWSSLCVLISSCKETSYIGLGSTLTTTF